MTSSPAHWKKTKPPNRLQKHRPRTSWRNSQKRTKPEPKSSPRRSSLRGHKPSADTRPRVGFSASRQGRCTGNHKNRVLERVTRKEQHGEKNLSIITRTSAYAEHDGRCVRPRHFQSRSLYTRPQQRFSCVPGWAQDRHFTGKVSGVAGKAGYRKFSHLGLAISLSL